MRNDSSSAASDDAGNADFDSWYATQGHWFANEQMCRLVWNRAWRTARGTSEGPIEDSARHLRSIHHWETPKQLPAAIYVDFVAVNGELRIRFWTPDEAAAERYRQHQGRVPILLHSSIAAA